MPGLFAWGKLVGTLEWLWAIGNCQRSMSDD
jgi:hypothetical protein